MSCLFCDLLKQKERIIYENDLVYAIYDSFPVNKGHILIIPKRHIKTYFELEKDELFSLDEAICSLKRKLDQLYNPSGYNIGINNGESAGQTIMHLHVHLIPRYNKDCDDPRGGVRGVIPEKQKY
ncbi:MAG: HIT family protein [Candidatus Izemoplasmatales bacterium]|nr:HIT family protein [Candidatus Izemoplasmatales bacterium]